MKLLEYLKKHDLTNRDFAEKVNVARTQITRIINKKRNPSAHLMKTIEEVTNGEVTMQDLFNPEAPTRFKGGKRKRHENTNE